MNPYEALKHAVRAHRDQVDWGGQPYILHPIAVSVRVDRYFDDLPAAIQNTAGGRPRAIIIALLHDVIEDTKYMLDPDDFTAAEWRALQLVTRYPDETYFDYVRHIVAAAREGAPLAAVVKLADLSHNMSAERKVGLTYAQWEKAERLTKQRYVPSRDMLWEALGVEWWPDTDKGVSHD